MSSEKALLHLMPQDEADLAQQIIKQLFDEQALRPTRITGKGTVNTVFAARVGKRDVVVRMRQESRALPEYQKEKWCIQQAEAMGIPSPMVLAVGALRATPYMVQMLVPGINGAEAHDQHEYLWQELGRYTKLIHSIQVAGFGDRLSDGEHGIFGNVPQTPGCVL